MSSSSTQVVQLGWQGSSSGGGGSGAPADATYITQTPNSTLTNEQALSLLSTGLMKVTTATGVVSVAVAGTDYVAPATTITAGSGLTGGGDFSTNRTISMPATGPGAGTIGTAGITTLTLDAQGRVTAATSAALVAQTIQVIAGTGLSGGGALSANVTLSLPNTGPGAGTIGTAGIATITLDAQGRVTAATTATFLTTAAPVNAQYLTLATDSTLTVERVFTPSTGLTVTDGGAGGNYTVTVDLSTGKSGGLTVRGGTATGETLVLRANTSDAITATLGKDNLQVNGVVVARGSTFTTATGGTFISNDLGGSAGLGCYNPTSGLASLTITAAAVTITNTGVNYLTISTVAVTMVNSQNLIFGTGAGTKLGTATTQKIGFWNVTPVIQPATTGTATGFTAGVGTPVMDVSTFTGGTGATAYRISDVVLGLKQAGILAA